MARTLLRYLKIILVIAVILVIIRIALPYGIKYFINKKIDALPEYTGYVKDVDLCIICGSFAADSFKLERETGKAPVPFIKLQRLAFSIEWKALFKGKIVGKVKMIRPEINVITRGSPEQKQTGTEVDWQKEVLNLMPIKINKFEITEGEFHYRDFISDPQVDFYLTNLNIIATNLTNVEKKDEPLPSHITGSAFTIGNGKITININVNALKKIPDLDLTMQLENMNLTALNDLTRAYTNLDIEKGQLFLYTELALDDGRIEGYVKPVIENIKVLNWKEEEGGFFDKIWEAIAGGGAKLLENDKKDRIATRVEVSQELTDPKIGVGQAIWNVIINAFIEALNRDLDYDIEYPVKKEEPDKKK